MKKIILITIGVVVAGAAGYWVFGRSAEAAITLKTTKVTKGNITNEVTATGTVEPITQVEVGTQVSGTIEKIYVDYNSQVKANQLIAELDKTTLKASVEDAKANLEAALNDQEYQQRNFDRIEKLAGNKVVSQTDYEEALYNLKSAKIVTAQRKTELAKAQTNLGYASIYSPIDGVVLSRSVDVGQTVAASYSTPTLFTIAQDLKQMQVEADVDEADIGQVSVGQRVAFTVDAYPDDEFSGAVTQVRLEPTEESNVITYTVIIKADNEDNKLMPGLTANITIYTKEINDVLLVEAKALNYESDQQLLSKYYQQQEIAPSPAQIPNGTYVWLKNGTQLSPKAITTGDDDGVYYEVTSGIKEGDELVYDLEETKAVVAESGEASSPFMPKPPGKK